MQSLSIWDRPPAKLILTDTDLHVWRAALDQASEIVQQLRGLLSADEQARADRFRFERDRRRYSVGRGVLRSILGRYLNCPPDRITFEYGAKGKPSLSPSPDAVMLNFNVAHSHELAVYAFTRYQPVGVDVEYALQVVNSADRLAARFFSPNETVVFGALSESEKRTAFFRCWTRKEAFIKASGAGLSQPLDRFDVAFAPDQPAAILNIDGDAHAAQHWSLFHLEPSPGYVGAVALVGRKWQLAGWVWGEAASLK